VGSDSHERDARATTAEPAAERSADALVREVQPDEETRGLGGPRSERILDSCLHAIERVSLEGLGWSEKWFEQAGLPRVKARMGRHKYFQASLATETPG